MKKCLPIVVGLLMSTALVSPSAHGQTLEEAMAAAYANNPTLRAQRATLRATDEEVPQALSNWRPTVTVTGTAGRSFNDSNSRTASGTRSQTRTQRTLDLSIDQPLFRGFRTLAETEAAEDTVRAGRAALTGTEQDVLLAAATAYMNVVRDQAVLELNTNNEEVLRRQLEATRDRFEVGELTRTDVSQAEARLAGATADRIQSEGNLEASRFNFRNIVGIMPDSLDPPSALDALLPTSENDAMDMAVGTHPDVVAARYEELAALDNIDLVRGELYPTVSLSASANRNFDTVATGSRVDDKSITANLSMPLYQSGSVYSRLRAAKQSAAKERLEVETAQRNVTEAAASAWEALVTARARERAFEAQIDAARIALEGVEREAQVGSRTVLDVLDAEQELLDAKVSLVRAQRDEMVAAFELLEAVGRLTAGNLNLPVPVYNPETHYIEVRDKWVGGDSSGDIEDPGLTPLSDGQ